VITRPKKRSYADGMNVIPRPAGFVEPPRHGGGGGDDSDSDSDD
jgi:hypothetical protein